MSGKYVVEWVEDSQLKEKAFTDHAAARRLYDKKCDAQPRGQAQARVVLVLAQQNTEKWSP